MAKVATVSGGNEQELTERTELPEKMNRRQQRKQREELIQSNRLQQKVIHFLVCFATLAAFCLIASGRVTSKMRVIPVIDLMDGQVVRGVAGRRAEYRPIQSSIAADPRPGTVARALVERFGFETVYVADLDAIQGGTRNIEAYEAIKDAGLKLWLDAGVGDPKVCSDVGDLLLSRSIEGAIVIALECLQDPYDARWWDNTPSAQFRAIFSLDLNDGVPIHHVAKWRSMSAAEIGHAIYNLCFRDIIVLDLADVGMSQGSRTLNLCRQLVDELDQVRIIAGGGVRGVSDLEALAEAGCDAALVASALHDGKLTREEIRLVENL